MADEQTGGATDAAAPAASAPTATSGTAAAAGDKPATGDGTTKDWKAEAESLQKQLDQARGRLGSTQQTLTEQLAAAKQEAAEAKALATKAERDRQHAIALESAMALAPSSMRALYREAARGMLLEADLTDPAAAAKAVHEKILAASPELVKQPVQHMPHAPNGQGARVGLSFTPGGKRLV